VPNRQIPPNLTQAWVFISYESRVSINSITRLHIMNRDLVLWRSTTGVISLQDAYCPHMGAHLGFGKVRGEFIECIFHKRKFDGDGKCIGQGKPNISYPIKNIHGLVFAWFGSSLPTWEMPDILSHFDVNTESSWKILRSKEYIYDFHPKDLLDNTVDAKHFKTFHNQCVSYAPVQILEKSKWHFISKVVFTGSPQLKLNNEMKLELVTESYGPTNLVVNAVVRVHSRVFFFKFIFLCTPIENEKTMYTLAIAVQKNHPDKRSLGRKLAEFLYNHYAFYMQVKEFRRESKEVWQHKTYLKNPDLDNQESSLKEYTAWYEEFYQNEAEAISVEK
jgi:3-ketosteroid 9alpha-monooxygenase subunit A